METAIEIAKSCNMIKTGNKQIILKVDEKEARWDPEACWKDIHK